MSDATSRKTQLIAWLLACVLTGVIGFMISWARADRAELRIRELAAENEALRAENEALRTDVGKLETPERFDIANNERAALAALRSILTAAMVYQAESAGGFPESLEALGPNGANILDEALVAGRRSGYVFTYVPAKTGDIYTSFHVVARPERSGLTGRRSFFIDERGAVRFTLEEREPTNADRSM